MASTEYEKGGLAHTPNIGPESPHPSPGSSVANLDNTYDAYRNAQELQVDPLEAKKVLRKIDKRVMTILFGTYMLQYLDKNSLNFASVYGLKAGTHIDGSQYSWLGRCSPLKLKNYNLHH